MVLALIIGDLYPSDTTRLASVGSGTAPTYDSSGDGDVTNDGQNQYLYIGVPVDRSSSTGRDGEGRVCAIKNMIGKMVQYLYRGPR